ncbi:MAG: hypothetical protein R2741_02805 [Methanolobus sp.]
MPNKNETVKENKWQPLISIAKALGLLIVVFFLLFAAFFMWSGYNHMHSKSIDAMLLETAPDEFVIVTEQEINNYPALKKAIDTQSYVETDPDEWLKTSDFLEEKGNSVIKFRDEYYQIAFTTA